MKNAPKGLLITGFGPAGTHTTRVNCISKDAEKLLNVSHGIVIKPSESEVNLRA